MERKAAQMEAVRKPPPADRLSAWLLESEETMTAGERNRAPIGQSEKRRLNSAANIKALLSLMGWSQTRLASEIRTTKETVNRWCNSGVPDSKESAPIRNLVERFRIVHDSIWEPKLRYLPDSDTTTDDQIKTLRTTARWPRIAALIEQEFVDEKRNAKRR